MKRTEWEICDIHRKKFSIIEDWIWYRLFEIDNKIPPKQVLSKRLSKRISLLFDEITENSEKALGIN